MRFCIPALGLDLSLFIDESFLFESKWLSWQIDQYIEIRLRKKFSIYQKLYGMYLKIIDKINQCITIRQRTTRYRFVHSSALFLCTFLSIIHFCRFFMLHFFNVVLFSCCTFFVLHPFLFHLAQVALFPCCTFFMLKTFFRVAFFSGCTFSLLHFFHLALFHLALFSSCTFLRVAPFFMLHFFCVTLISCCTFFVLHYFRVVAIHKVGTLT